MDVISFRSRTQTVSFSKVISLLGFIIEMELEGNSWIFDFRPELNSRTLFSVGKM
jgi:hypothetical protein